MSEPRRLSEEGGSDFELALLRSARLDAPPPASRRKTLVALGLAGSVSATMTTSTATAAVKSASTLLFLKWIGAGAVGGLLALGAITVGQEAAVTTGPRASVTAAPQTAPSPGPARVTMGPQVVPTPEPAAPAPIDTAVAPVEAPAPTPSAIAAPARSAPASVTEEIASLDVARVALDAGDAARALAALDAHARRFPRGMLGQEATVLRIEALVLHGDRATARSLGIAFLAAHPKSAHASRLRSLLGLRDP